MSFNRIAIYGHRGWAAAPIVKALIASGAPVRVLYRPGSKVENFTSTTDTVQVDVNDTAALIQALQDIDIVISLVGQLGVASQLELVKAIPSTDVKLFVPSDLSAKNASPMLDMPVLEGKDQVLQAAKDAGVSTTVIWPALFFGSSFSTKLLGVDYAGNRIVYTGDSENQKLSLCSQNYVSTAYASIFAKTPISEIANRTIGLSELVVTGADIASALERKYGSPPKVYRQSIEQVEAEIKKRASNGDRTAMVLSFRWPWGKGIQPSLIGDDIWEVEGYHKLGLNELFLEGKLEPYKEIPPPLEAGLETTFF